MSIKGKLIGGTFGAVVGGPIGAIIGFALGSIIDNSKETPTFNNNGSGYTEENNMLLYLAATFAIAGKLAKSDGHVSKGEIEATRKLMRDLELDDRQIEYSIKVFNESKSNSVPIEDYINQYKSLSDYRSRKALVSFLVALSFADNRLDDNELLILKKVIRIFDLSEDFLNKLLESYGRGFSSNKQNLKPYYDILGLPDGSPLNEVNKAYRLKVKEYHPDKISSKGLPDKFIKFAEEEFNKVQGAYEVLKSNLSK